MSRSLRVLPAVLAAGLLAACAGSRPGLEKVGAAEGGEVVEATGEAIIVKEDPLGTKKKSLLDAQKKAVEMVVGVRVSGKILVEKAVAIQDTILAKTEGYINKYDVLREWDEPPFHKTKIRAYVAYQKVVDDLNAQGLLKKPEVGHPRVAVLLTEKVEGMDAVGSAGQSVTQALLDQGYKVVDRADLLAANAEAVAHEVEKGNVGGVASLGQKLNAEVLIFGTAGGSQVQSDMLGGMYSFRASVSLQAYKAQTNEVLYTSSKLASAIDIAKDAAAVKALALTGKQAGEDLASRLAQELAKRANVIVTASGVTDLGRLRQLQTALAGMSGVGYYYLRSYEGEKAVLEVNVNGTSGTELADGIAKDAGLKARVSSATHDTLSVELLP